MGTMTDRDNKNKMYSKSYTRHQQLGLSLTELLVVVAIIAILVSLSVSGLHSMVKRNRLAAASDEFYSSLLMARSEAIKRQANVVLCAKDKVYENCNNTGSNEDYADGWYIFLDCNNNGVYETTSVCDIDADGTNETADELIGLTKPYNTDVSILGGTPHAARVSFGVSGRVTEGAGTIQVKTGSTTFKTLELNRSGSVYFD